MTSSTQRILATVLLAVLLAGPAMAVTDLATLQLWWSSGRRMAVGGDYLYVTTDDTGLRVVDISDPDNPAEVGSYPTIPCYWIDAEADLLVTEDDDEVVTWDVSDPTDPQPLATLVLEPQRSIQRILIDGTECYLSDVGLEEFIVLDISDPQDPAILTSYPTNDMPTWLARGGDLLAVNLNNNGIRLYDVSDPVDPVHRNHLFPGEDIESLAMRDTWLVARNHLDEVQMVDVSDPLNPQQVWSGDYDGQLSWHGDRLFIRYWLDNSLTLLDVTDPTDPQHLATHTLSETSVTAQASSSDVFAVMYQNSGVSLTDVSAWDDPREAGDLYTIGNPRQFEIAGDYVYVAGEGSGINIIDVTDWRTPARVGQIMAGQRNEVIARRGHLLHGDFQNPDYAIYDISVPDQPTLAGQVNYLSSIYDLAVNGGVMATVGYYGLRLYDVSDPANPTQLSTLAFDDWHLNDIIISGHMAYIAAYSGPGNTQGFHIVELRYPEPPLLRSTTIIPSAGQIFDLDMEGDQLYVGYNKLGIWKVDNPDNPTMMAEVDFPGILTYGLDVEGGLAYHVNNDYELHVYDVSDPDNITMELTHDLSPGTGFFAEVDGGRVVCSSNYTMHFYDTRDDLGLAKVDLDVSAAYPIEVEHWETIPLTVRLRSEADVNQEVDVWTELITRQGDVIGPLWMATDMHTPPSLDIELPAFTRRVPWAAVVGNYTWRINVGDYPDRIAAREDVPFKVVPTLGATPAAGTGDDKILTLAGDLQPTSFALGEARPNPFNPTSTLRLDLPSSGDVRVTVFDITGRQVATLADGTYPAGRHTLTVNGSRWASGVYFVRAVVPGELDVTRKLVLLR